MAKVAASELMIWTALAIVYVVWGSTYLAIRVAVESIPPLMMAGVRFLIAGSILFAWRLIALGRSAPRITAREWRAAAIIAAALMLGGNGGVAIAERTLPSGITALVVATVPLWIAVIDRVWFNNALTIQRIAGLAIGIGAIALLVGLPDTHSVDLAGASIAVVSSIAWAAGSVYARGAKLPADASTAIGMEMLVGGVLLVIAGAFAGEFADPTRLHPSAPSWWAFWYLVVFGGLVGFSAYLWLLRVAPIARVSTHAYVNPVIAIVLGWLILREPLGTHTIAAAIAILAAVALISWTPKPKARADQRDLTSA